MQRLVPMTEINFFRFHTNEDGTPNVNSEKESILVYGRITDKKAKKILDEKVGEGSYIFTGMESKSEMRYMSDEDFLKYSSTEKTK